MVFKVKVIILLLFTLLSIKSTLQSINQGCDLANGQSTQQLVGFFRSKAENPGYYSYNKKCSDGVTVSCIGSGDVCGIDVNAGSGQCRYLCFTDFKDRTCTNHTTCYCYFASCCGCAYHDDPSFIRCGTCPA